MLTGRRFVLNQSTIALNIVDGKDRAIRIPAGATIKVVSDLKTNNMVDVSWEGKTFTVFAVDVKNRGAAVRSRKATA